MIIFSNKLFNEHHIERSAFEPDPYLAEQSARGAGRGAFSARREACVGARSGCVPSMDFSLYSSPCAFRERCSDPLPEAGLTKAKLKYRNERVEKTSTRPLRAARGWVGGPILHLSRSRLDKNPHALKPAGGPELPCRGPRGTHAAPANWGFGVGTGAPSLTSHRIFYGRSLGTPGHGRVFLSRLDSGR